jgi:hypothetical protein
MQLLHACHSSCLHVQAASTPRGCLPASAGPTLESCANTAALKSTPSPPSVRSHSMPAPGRVAAASSVQHSTAHERAAMQLAATAGDGTCLGQDAPGRQSLAGLSSRHAALCPPSNCSDHALHQWGPHGMAASWWWSPERVSVNLMSGTRACVRYSMLRLSAMPAPMSSAAARRSTPTCARSVWPAGPRFSCMAHTRLAGGPARAQATPQAWPRS